MEHLLANTDPADDGVEWAALAARVRPEIEAAAAAVAADGDEAAYFNALADFAQAAGDGLVTVTPADDATPTVAQANAVRQEADQGTLGVDVVELDDGRIVVVYVAPGSQAATAGVKPGMDLRGGRNAGGGCPGRGRTCPVSPARTQAAGGRRWPTCCVRPWTPR
ncbi:MAG: PDZ domain-containing protein [Caldilineaceae bacterium]